MFNISKQLSTHSQSIEELLDCTFGNERKKRVSYRYRDGIPDIPTLRFVALRADKLIGTIRFWPILIKGKCFTDGVLLGPLGISPRYQGQGVGTALIKCGIKAASKEARNIIILVGELPYYERFGFQLACNYSVTMPDEKFSKVLIHDINGRYDADGVITKISHP